MSSTEEGIELRDLELAGLTVGKPGTVTLRADVGTSGGSQNYLTILGDGQALAGARCADQLWKVQPVAPEDAVRWLVHEAAGPQVDEPATELAFEVLLSTLDGAVRKVDEGEPEDGISVLVAAAVDQRSARSFVDAWRHRSRSGGVTCNVAGQDGGISVVDQTATWFSDPENRFWMVEVPMRAPDGPVVVRRVHSLALAMALVSLVRDAGWASWKDIEVDVPSLSAGPIPSTYEGSR